MQYYKEDLIFIPLLRRPSLLSMTKYPQTYLGVGVIVHRVLNLSTLGCIFYCVWEDLPLDLSANARSPGSA